MIEGAQAGTTGGHAIQLANIVRARFAPGRISLPVAPDTLYARFKHVQGVPTLGATPGYSVTKLQMLDSLVERLTGVSPERESESNISVAADRLSEMLERRDYGATVGRAMSADRISGLIFNLVA